MLNAMLSQRVDVPGMTKDSEPYFRDLYDHLIKINDLVDSHRDLVSSSMDTYIANGEGDSPEAAIADLREALKGLIAEFGPPDELTLTLDVALCRRCRRYVVTGLSAHWKGLDLS